MASKASYGSEQDRKSKMGKELPKGGSGHMKSGTGREASMHKSEHHKKHHMKKHHGKK